MSDPTAELRSLYDRSRRAFASAAARPAAATPVAGRIFDALAAVERAGPIPGAATLPACAHLEPALASADAVTGVVADLSRAFRTLVPHLAWQRRAGSRTGPAGFHDGHANTIIAGPRGLDARDDVLVGASLMAPGVRYPDHSHPPEEIYVVLSPGEWWQEGGDWHEPGPGGVVHNPPGILHAMRAGESPLLALWFLWTGTAGGPS